MKMLKITRTADLVRFRHEVTLPIGTTEERDVTAHDAPKKKFDAALQALAEVAVKILELPLEYGKGITVVSLGISRTKHGTRSATIYFTKQIDKLELVHAMATPSFRIDDPAAGEDKELKRQVLPRHASLVEDMITQAEQYAEGDRLQMSLPLGEKTTKEAEDDKQPQLELREGGRSGCEVTRWPRSRRRSSRSTTSRRARSRPGRSVSTRSCS